MTALAGRGTRLRGLQRYASKLAASPDVPLIAATTLGLTALAEVLAPAQGQPGYVPGELALALGATLPLAFARAHLLLAAVTVTASTLFTPVAYDDRTPCWSGLPALATVLFLVGLRRSARTAVLFAIPFVAYALATDGGPYGVALLAGAAGALSAGATRRARAEAARRSAADWAYADTVLAHAALGERARIARELHDIVAHHISTISVQAETARFTTPDLPEAGAQKLLAIGDTARLALTEMRRLLGVLREEPPATAPTATAPVRTPQPGLDQLVSLVDKARSATAATIRLIVSGRVTSLDPGLELTAYRIVQEALTNARRHAPGSAVDVELHYSDAELTLRIRDCGPGTPSAPTEHPSPGHGLLGMRERTAMAGGTLHAGPGPAGGFTVTATLPAKGPATP
ncbi:sensor histidine kinase [Streptomyces sp. NPDC059009]|uniref:sensor histidine kinase n=1 Tax=Streptomyces sp. NPDC059009 TaxID=3346694 RepID=UPI0036BDBE23